MEVSYEQIRHVAHRMRRQDAREIYATRLTDNPDHLAADAYICQTTQEIACVTASDGEPVAIVGARLRWPFVWSVFMFATDRWLEGAIDATRYIQKRLIPRITRLGYVRADCMSLASRSSSHRWLEHLGAKREALVKAWGKHGEDFVLYTWFPRHG